MERQISRFTFSRLGRKRYISPDPHTAPLIPQNSAKTQLLDNQAKKKPKTNQLLGFTVVLNVQFAVFILIFSTFTPKKKSFFCKK